MKYLALFLLSLIPTDKYQDCKTVCFHKVIYCHQMCDNVPEKHLQKCRRYCTKHYVRCLKDCDSFREVNQCRGDDVPKGQQSEPWWQEATH